MKLEYIVEKSDVNKPIRAILQNKLNISSRLLKKLKNIGLITVNGDIAFVNELCRENDKIVVDISINEENDHIVPQKGDLDIVFEDEYFVAVNKPAGMVVHPSVYHQEGTLSNYLKYYLDTNNRLHPINRLDKGTSGVVLFAKNEYIQESFIRMKEKPSKVYITLVEGTLKDRGRGARPSYCKERGEHY